MAVPNGLNPSFERIGLKGGTNAGVVILAGTATDDATIKAEVGTPGTDVSVGSIYIGTSTSTPTIWVASVTFWMPLTIT